jgi:C4-dicarboxylate transporter, DctM subunit
VPPDDLADVSGRGAGAAALILADNYPLFVLLKETFTGIDSFPLMAVPFFILAAELMSGGSLTEVLLKFAGQPATTAPMQRR